MKRKIILLALSVAAVTVLCGCGQRSAEDNTTAGGTATNATVAPTTTPSTPAMPPPAAAPAMTNSASTNN